MFQRPRELAALGLIGLCTLGLGCGDAGKPSVDTSTTKATVKGTVTFKGNPVTKGEIAFDPSNFKRKDVAAVRVPIGPDGSYTVETLIGENRVSFAIPAMMRDPKLQDLSLTYEVKSGENTFDIVLPPPDMSP